MSDVSFLTRPAPALPERIQHAPLFKRRSRPRRPRPRSSNVAKKSEFLPASGTEPHAVPHRPHTGGMLRRPEKVRRRRGLKNRSSNDVSVASLKRPSGLRLLEHTGAVPGLLGSPSRSPSPMSRGTSRANERDDSCGVSQHSFTSSPKHGFKTASVSANDSVASTSGAKLHNADERDLEALGGVESSTEPMGESKMRMERAKAKQALMKIQALVAASEANSAAHWDNLTTRAAELSAKLNGSQRSTSRVVSAREREALRHMEGKNAAMGKTLNRICEETKRKQQLVNRRQEEHAAIVAEAEAAATERRVNQDIGGVLTRLEEALGEADKARRYRETLSAMETRAKAECQRRTMRIDELTQSMRTIDEYYVEVRACAERIDGEERIAAERLSKFSASVAKQREDLVARLELRRRELVQASNLANDLQEREALREKMKEKVRIRSPKRLHDLKSKVKNQLVMSAVTAMGDLARLGGGVGSSRTHQFGDVQYTDKQVRDAMRTIESALGVSVDSPEAIVRCVIELEERSHRVEVEKLERTARLASLLEEKSIAQAHLTDIENMFGSYQYVVRRGTYEEFHRKMLEAQQACSRNEEMMRSLDSVLSTIKMSVFAFCQRLSLIRVPGERDDGLGRAGTRQNFNVLDGLQRFAQKLTHIIRFCDEELTSGVPTSSIYDAQVAKEVPASNSDAEVCLDPPLQGEHSGDVVVGIDAVETSVCPPSIDHFGAQPVPPSPRQLQRGVANIVPNLLDIPEPAASTNVRVVSTPGQKEAPVKPGFEVLGNLLNGRVEPTEGSPSRKTEEDDSDMAQHTQRIPPSPNRANTTSPPRRASQLPSGFGVHNESCSGAATLNSNFSRSLSAKRGASKFRQHKESIEERSFHELRREIRNRSLQSNGGISPSVPDSPNTPGGSRRKERIEQQKQSDRRRAESGSTGFETALRAQVKRRNSRIDLDLSAFQKV